MAKVEIPFSKSKQILEIGGSVLFVVLGFFLITTIADLQTRTHPLFVKIVGAASILFFGMTGFFGIKSLFKKTTGLIIDDYGITDYSNITGTGLIKWTDIKGMRTENTGRSKFILLFTVNPEIYLNKAGGSRKNIMEANMKLFGTPLILSSNGLKCSFKELEKLISDRLNEKMS